MNKRSLAIAIATSLMVALFGAVLDAQDLYHVAMYCESANFNLANHADEFVIDYSLTCYDGATFDANVGEFTNESIDVIFIGGDNSFSIPTALAIEDAVYNSGKVFVVNFWSNRNFDASLPAQNAGNAPYGTTLTVEDPTHPVFEGLPTVYTNSGPSYNREHAIEKDGATVLLRYDNNDPALLYWKYGDGYVIEWTLEQIHQFFDPADLDSINYRLIKLLQERIRAADIASITDIPNDQGRLVRILWLRSNLDKVGSSTPITGYSIFRKIDWNLESIIPQTGTGNNEFNRERPLDVEQTSMAYPPGDWDFIKVVPADCEDYYSTIVPTLADSTISKGMYYTEFFVRARTDAPGVYYDSPPDSGYSVDNLAPSTPQGFEGRQIGYDLMITWQPNVESDLGYYAVYRDDTLMTTTIDTFVTDFTWHPDNNIYSYKLTAIDLNGNESEWAELKPGDIVATLLQSYSSSFRDLWIEISWILSECDSGIEFYIMRAAVPDGEFLELSRSGLIKDGLTFIYKDRNYEPGVSYCYRVEVDDEDGRRILFETNPISTPVLHLTLYQNHPNPFNPSTTIKYYLPEKTHVILEIYDISGRRISCLINEKQDKGHYIKEWKGLDDKGNSLASGIYFYKLVAGKETVSRKMVIIR